MDVIHAEEVDIARERARAIYYFFKSKTSPLALRSTMRGIGTTITGSDINEYVSHEIERLEVRKNRIVELRASITREDHSSAFQATESAIKTQFELELRSIFGTSDEYHHQEELKTLALKAAAALAALAPEVEGLKRVSITKECNGKDVGEEGDKCAICHEEWKSEDDVRSIVGCNHAYHYKCISKWIKRKPTCPMCRYQIPTNTTNKRLKTTTSS